MVIRARLVDGAEDVSMVRVEICFRKLIRERVWILEREMTVVEEVEGLFTLPLRFIQNFPFIAKLQKPTP